MNNADLEQSARRSPIETVYPCLDHGYVKYIDHLGSDEFIVECARMSTGKGFKGWNTDMAMLDYMYRNRHTSPFEFGVLVVEVQAPIMVFRQWHRHRTFTYSEASGRYTELPHLYFVPSEDRLRKQSTTNKQASGGSSFSEAESSWICKNIETDQHRVRESYRRYLEMGLARELARVNCPVSQYSRMRAIGNLKNWLHFLNLRLDKHAQPEIRAFAEPIEQLIKDLWPRTYSLFLEYDINGQHMSATEVSMLNVTLGSDGIHTLYQMALQQFGEKRALEFIRKLQPSFPDIQQ